MLQNEHSPYYGLIEDTVAHVDAERLFRFGMNVGYNGCTEGASTIREIEENERYNIPWTMFLHLDAQQLSEHYGQYQSLISQGVGAGNSYLDAVSREPDAGASAAGPGASGQRVCSVLRARSRYTAICG